MRKISCIMVYLFLISNSALAAVITEDTTQPEPNAYCPQISQLLKNPVKGNWYAQTTEGYWQSYDMSFATNIDQFLGAQWVGENLGQITCVYRSSQRFTVNGALNIQKTLPVLLVYHALTHQPSGQFWKKRPGHGVYDCYGQTLQDCPFRVHLQPKETDIFKEAASFKSQQSQQNLSPLDGD